MPEVRSHQLRESPDELPVGQAQQEMVLQVLREQEGSFLRAGRAEVEPLAGKKTKILVFTVRIGALNAGNPLGIVSAEDELLRNFRDTLNSEPTVEDSVFVFVLIGEPLEVFIE
ncbi:hypothetical protein ES703_82427 [subsurface metagenome]